MQPLRWLQLQFRTVDDWSPVETSGLLCARTRNVRIGGAGALLAIVIAAVTACQPSQPALEATGVVETGSFDRVFSPVSSVRIAGTKETPLQTTFRPAITGERIIVPDVIGRQVFVFDRVGRLLMTLSSFGAGEPVGTPNVVAVDERGTMYVNDYGGARVRVVGSHGGFIRDIPIAGQNQLVFLRQRPASVFFWRNSEPVILTVGKAWCSYEMPCLVHMNDLRGRRVDQYAVAPKGQLIASWEAAFDTAGNLYLINANEDDVEVYSPNGDLIRRFTLGSSVLLPFGEAADIPEASATTAGRVIALSRVLRHTRVEGFYVHSGRLYVQAEIMNGTNNDAQYVMEVFDLHGQLRIAAFEVPGMLRQVSAEGFFFCREDASAENGGAIIDQYSLRDNYSAAQ